MIRNSEEGTDASQACEKSQLGCESSRGLRGCGGSTAAQPQDFLRADTRAGKAR